MLQVDLTDLKAEMIVTVSVNENLVHQYEDKIIPGMGVSISGFEIQSKSDYDRGDCDCILVLKETSTVETINHICNDYNFIPNTTIRNLLNSTSNYSIGIVGALVIVAQKQGNVNILEIKDGHYDEDRAQVTINRNHFFNCTFSNYWSIYFTNTQLNVLNSIYIFYADGNPSKFYLALHLSRRTSYSK